VTLESQFDPLDKLGSKNSKRRHSPYNQVSAELPKNQLRTGRKKFTQPLDVADTKVRNSENKELNMGELKNPSQTFQVKVEARNLVTDETELFLPSFKKFDLESMLKQQKSLYNQTYLSRRRQTWNDSKILDLDGIPNAQFCGEQSMLHVLKNMSLTQRSFEKLNKSPSPRSRSPKKQRLLD
jgi:hypothetical protein